MAVQRRLDQLAAMGLVPGDGAGLVGLDMPGIADHVDRQDRGKPAGHAVGAQKTDLT
jgi:hypothetical protein